MICILQSKFDDVVGRIVQSIKACGDPGPDGMVSFSIEIDAEKVQTNLETSSRYKVLIGCPCPNHFLIIGGLYS